MALNEINGADTSLNNNNGEEQEQEIEYMRNVVFLSKEFGFTYDEIMSMPYSIFLSYLRWGRQFILESNSEFMEKVNSYSKIEETEPDMAKLRNLKL